MPMITLWDCIENSDGKTTDCHVDYSVKEWFTKKAKGGHEIQKVHGDVEAVMRKLQKSLPSGTITVEYDKTTLDNDLGTIKIAGIDTKDMKHVKQKIEGKDGIKDIKRPRGKVKQSPVGLKQTMTCHKNISKDNKSLSVWNSLDNSPYDNLPHLKPTMVVVHTEKLMEEWASKMESFLGIPRDELGQIGGGRKDHCFVTLSTIQSLSKKEINEALKGRINLLISDEVHHSSANEWKKAVCGLNTLKEKEYQYITDDGKLSSKKVTVPTKLVPVDKRTKTLGLSATPTPYGEERTEIIESCVGPKLINIKDSDIINQGYILPVKMIRESIVPEERTTFMTDVARLMGADFNAEISEKKASATEDHQRSYDTNVYEQAFEKAIGGTQYTASAYDENKIKRAISRIAETPDEKFIVYSPRVIPLYAVSTLVRNLGIDENAVPFIGKGSQNITKYKTVKEQIGEMIEEINKKEEEVKETETKIKIKGYQTEGDKQFLENLKGQANMLKEILKAGHESFNRKLFDINVDWITTDPSNKIPMSLDEFYKTYRKSSLKEEDLRPPIQLPFPTMLGTMWLPRAEFKPKKFKDLAIANAPSPWESEMNKNSYARLSSYVRWGAFKNFNPYLTNDKDLKVGTSVIAHGIEKEAFKDKNIRENFGSGKSRVLPISTAGQEGVDIPSANNLIVLSIFTKPKDPIQLTGRIKRPSDGKKPGEALFLNVKNTSDDIYFRSLMKGLLLDVHETEHGDDIREELMKELSNM